MRTYEEIYTEIQAAINIKDVQRLRALAAEVQVLGTPHAGATALFVSGVVASLTGDHASALEHYQHALTMSAASDDTPLTARIINNMGHVHASIGNISAALEHYTRALRMSEELGDRPGVARATSNLGVLYDSTGDFASALEYHSRAMSMAEELDNRAALALAYGNIASVYWSTGDYALSIENHGRALAIHSETGHRIGEADAIGNMGTVYQRTGDYPQALEHFRRALALYEEVGDRSGEARSIANIGTVYQSTGDHALALEQYRRALVMNEEMDDRSALALTLGNIGNVYDNIGDGSAALEYHRRALALHEQLGNPTAVALTIGNMASVLLGLRQYSEAAEMLDQQARMQLDDPCMRAIHYENYSVLLEHRDDIDQAHRYLTDALKVSDEAGLRANAMRCHERLRDLAQKRNDFAGYIEHNNAYQRISEEIRGKEVTQRMAMMEAERKAEGERREREKERAVLYSTLPKHVADRVVRGEKVTGDHYDHATVIFLDIVGFTAISDSIPPGHVVHLLEQIFTTLDVVCKKHDVTKIKTIGDSYMAVSFESVVNAAHCALDMLDALAALTITMPPDAGDTSWTKDVGEINVRIGMHCGPVTAGVIGTERMQYDVWGDTVNVASRMESSGQAGRVHISAAYAAEMESGIKNQETDQESRFKKLIGNNEYRIQERGEVDVKGKGMMTTYWLERAS